MTDSKRKEISRKLILEAVKKYRGLFNKSPSDDDCELYADMLVAEFEFKQVTWALTELIKKGSPFFPSCGEIFALLQPVKQTKEDLAPQVATEVLKALKDFSQYDEDKMLKSVSPVAREVFKAIGSTMDLRLSENIETARAQVERLAKGIIASADAAQKNQQLSAIGVARAAAHEIKSSGLNKLEFKDML